ncbi:phosphoadenylyl-sulfate reductase [Effusibacillus lacus]|uniref:Adenosine 5'-phosphosulfate reductase n=1 Tax=Effusibacillus lacus TaxID=1348429 RepID=A0A292YHY4_9BACL|nr:phosphoadenylyl-sulfate reductase [Effusibacillus lacus]TCS68527.1 phosphoadenosine phosphosulfate reductase [Effusibacillus lacus]GAX88409.1 phosphoadenosine phosphosulfate reductase [Effusibacillus lacus]
MNDQKELVLSPEKVQELNSMMEDSTPQEILRFALETIDNIAFACSFGAEDVALIDMIVKIKPETKIFYLDTDVLFQETYEVRDRIAEKYNPNLIRYSPLLTLEEQKAQHGDELWAKDPNACCNIRKVEPLTRALSELDAWITGIRREQAPTRANAGVIEVDAKFGLIKFNPLAKWTNKQVWDYILANEVPYNVLHDQGYPSIGCTHCTRPVKPGEDPRAGRWAGFAKTECGLHK